MKRIFLLSISTNLYATSYFKLCFKNGLIKRNFLFIDKDTFQYNHDHNPHLIYMFLSVILKKERKDDRAADLHLSFLSHRVSPENLPAAFDG